MKFDQNQLTGGIGRADLTCFYRDNFIFNNSADTELELISRTIGIDRIVDEFIFKFTHDRVIDWLYDIDSTDLSIYLW
jgi:carboxymethylenebutenolidase